MKPLLYLIIIGNILGCGVKGPPEPPYPTEAQLKKEKEKKDAQKKSTAKPSEAKQ